ncbi:ABC transporter substrate-binding protein [Actinoplanes sp. TBRC 11911]|uniref:ABC transporter substrate-binding protein n=1 Tax=Actinoplanes sp. TBRC 11911 TaxID=2729386 RepID=UPI00145C8A07|nr:ABC transporter substrate-binding protein [Actinoplanes sp. TBRC 11911]NMO50760.1 ABC transporter substrate-binding protein [Actinoplanes sp. TBRC 11911]
MARWSRVLVVAVVVVAGGCSSSAPSSSSAPVDHVTYMTGFGAVGRDSFVWVAREKGWFKEAGIEVDIQKGAGNTPNLTALKSNQAQFAAMDFSGAEILAAQGKFTEWRAVAAVHQQTLVSIMTTKDTGITTPVALKGKTIATASGSVSELLFPGYAKLAGLDPATVKMQGTQTTALNGLMAKGQVDAVSTFLLSKKALETATKKEVVVMPYSDYLKNLYGNVIVTRSDLLAKDRDLVSRFTGAALKGLRYTLDHPDEAAAILHAAEPTAAIPAAVGEITAMKQFSTPVGHLDQQRVTAGIAELEAAGLMPTGLTPAQVADFSLA